MIIVENNLFIGLEGFLLFFKIKLVYVVLVLKVVIVECCIKIDEVLVIKLYIWNDLVLLLEEVDDKLLCLFLLVLYMNFVVNNDELCEVYE